MNFPIRVSFSPTCHLVNHKLYVRDFYLASSNDQLMENYPIFPCKPFALKTEEDDLLYLVDSQSEMTHENILYYVERFLLILEIKKRLNSKIFSDCETGKLIEGKKISNITFTGIFTENQEPIYVVHFSS